MNEKCRETKYKLHFHHIQKSLHKQIIKFEKEIAGKKIAQNSQHLQHQNKLHNSW